MNKNTLDFIRDLSLKDKKTLSQKALKTAEESGELAKAVLPFESAYATRHRFVDKHKILEESVDVILTAISIAYELGFSHDEIEEALENKAIKWQSLQAKEDKANFPVPFEIHITVKYTQPTINFDSTEIDFFEHFKDTCQKIGVKPIVLDLEKHSGQKIKDVMTSSKCYGDNRTAYDEVQRISNALSYAGFEVVREKVETVPWHPGAPDGVEKKDMPKNCYFESHFGVLTNNSEEERARLTELCKLHDLHISRNAFKKLAEGKYVVMLTLRDYKSGYNSFSSKVSKVLEVLKNNNWELFEKEIVEFSIYDTKISHDFIWLNEKEKVETI
jgi:NTP pyrophosphatase (non-canonical NTP hydrolase)